MRILHGNGTGTVCEVKVPKAAGGLSEGVVVEGSGLIHNAWGSSTRTSRAFSLFAATKMRPPWPG